MSALVRVVWSTMRPPVLLLLVMYAVVGVLATGTAATTPVLRAALVVVPFLVYSAVVNDLADRRIDQINLPDDHRRLFAAGSAHRRQLLAVATLGAATMLAAAASLGWTTLGVAVAGLAVSTAYSLGPIRLAHRGILAPLVLPACYVAVPFLIGGLSASGRITLDTLPLLAALYVGFIARVILKDFRDVRGDSLFGKRTFLIRHGRVSTCRVSAVCWVVAAAILVAVSPHRSAAFAISTAAGTFGALVLLRELSRDHGARRDEWLVSAIAITGRGLLLVLLLTLGTALQGWSTWASAAVTAAVAIGFGGQAWQTALHGPARAVAASLPARHRSATH